MKAMIPRDTVRERQGACGQKRKKSAMETINVDSNESWAHLDGVYGCPTPGCSYYVWLDDDDCELRSCPVCGKSSCMKCRAQPYHKDRTCSQSAKNRTMASSYIVVVVASIVL
jgi:hypothetical protein